MTAEIVDRIQRGEDLRRRGWSVARVSRALGVAPRQVVNDRLLAGLDGEAKAVLQRGALSYRDALLVARLPAGDQGSAAASLAHSHGGKRARLRAAVRDRGRRQPRADAAASPEGGRVVTADHLDDTIDAPLSPSTCVPVAAILAVVRYQIAHHGWTAIVRGRRG